MPRTKSKTEIVTIRMQPWMKAELQRKAREAHTNLSEYMCLCGLGKKIVQVDGLTEVLSELKAQGRNLNQLTTLANMGRLQFVRGDEIMDAYAKLQEQLSEITKVVK